MEFLSQIFLRRPSKPSQAKSAFNLIDNLPPELILEICNHLPEESRVCLALTCRSLHHLLARSVITPEFVFPSVFDRTFTINGCVALPKSERNNQGQQRPRRTLTRQRLLRLLQNNSWLYCSRCLKLHPSAEFSVFQLLLRPTRKRYCFLGCKPSTVGICPGYTLSFRQRDRLIQYLKEEPTSPDPYPDQKETWNAPLGVPDGSLQVDICVMKPTLGDNGYLIYTIQYIIWCMGDPMPRKHAVVIPICPHLSLRLPLEKTDGGGNQSSCRLCQTNMVDFRANRVGYYFKILRYLGRDGTYPTDEWRAHVAAKFYKLLGATI